MYAAQYDKLSIAQRKRTKVLNRPENLTLDSYLDEDEDDLLPMPLLEDHEEKVNSVPEEKIAERVKLNPRKEKKNRNINQNFHSKQTVNQISSIISTTKRWK